MATATPWLAGQRITADQLNGIIMDWTALSDLGTFQTGFSAGDPVPRMQKLYEHGTEIWQFEGRIASTGFAAASTQVCFVFNSGFIVSGERGFQCYGSSTAYYGARVGFVSSGNMTVGVPSAAGSSTSGFNLDDIRITNPLG